MQITFNTISFAFQSVCCIESFLIFKSEKITNKNINVIFSVKQFVKY